MAVAIDMTVAIDMSIGMSISAYGRPIHRLDWFKYPGAQHLSDVDPTV